MYYVKYFHVVCAIVSLSGFVLRGAWMLGDSPMLKQRWVRFAPHVVDTLLLTSGVTMAAVWHISPMAHPWLAAKLTALIAYILLGTIALKRGKTRRIRKMALGGALATFAYMAAVAVTHDPLPGF